MCLFINTLAIIEQICISVCNGAVSPLTFDLNFVVIAIALSTNFIHSIISNKNLFISSEFPTISIKFLFKFFISLFFNTKHAFIKLNPILLTSVDFFVFVNSCGKLSDIIFPNPNINSNVFSSAFLSRPIESKSCKFISSSSVISSYLSLL